MCVRINAMDWRFGQSMTRMHGMMKRGVCPAAIGHIFNPIHVHILPQRRVSWGLDLAVCNHLRELGGAFHTAFAQLCDGEDWNDAGGHEMPWRI